MLSNQTLANYRSRLRLLYETLPFLEGENAETAKEEIRRLENKTGCEGPPSMKTRGRKKKLRAEISEEVIQRAAKEKERSGQVEDGRLVLNSQEALTKYRIYRNVGKALAQQLGIAEDRITEEMIQTEIKRMRTALGTESSALEDTREEVKVDAEMQEVMWFTGKPMDEITPELLEKYRAYKRSLEGDKE